MFIGVYYVGPFSNATERIKLTDCALMRLSRSASV